MTDKDAFIHFNMSAFRESIIAQVNNVAENGFDDVQPLRLGDLSINKYEYENKVDRQTGDWFFFNVTLPN